MILCGAPYDFYRELLLCSFVCVLVGTAFADWLPQMYGLYVPFSYLSMYYTFMQCIEILLSAYEAYLDHVVRDFVYSLVLCNRTVIYDSCLILPCPLSLTLLLFGKQTRGLGRK